MRRLGNFCLVTLVTITVTACATAPDRLEVTLKPEVEPVPSGELPGAPLESTPSKPLVVKRKVVAPAAALAGDIDPDEVQGDDATPPEMQIHLSAARVSKDLGVSEAQLRPQALLLARYLDNNHYPRRECFRGENKEVCDFMRELQENPMGSGRRAREPGGRRVPIKPQHFRAQQAMGYNRLLKSFTGVPASHVLTWSPLLLAHTACPRNLSAAALRKLEELLPSAAARTAMEKVYEHAAACLRPEEEAFEIAHFRQALLRLSWGDNEGARSAIRRAAQSNNPSERSRTLYWAGHLESDPHKRNAYWSELVNDQPLSFHALLAWRETKQDPLQVLAGRPQVKPRDRIKGRPALNRSLRWLDALYLASRTQAASELTLWIQRRYRSESTPGVMLYLSALKNKVQSHASKITMLTRQVNDNPDVLNAQTLRMMFPKPFEDIFSRNADRTDLHLLLAVARQESGFNHQARSPANARGLLQVLPSTARLVTKRRWNNLYNPDLNVEVGVKYLSKLIAQYNSVELALIAYNAGPGRVPIWQKRFPIRDNVLFLDLIPFKETRGYVASILRNNYWYDRLYGRPGAPDGDEPLQRSRLVSVLVQANTKAPRETAL